MEFCRQEYLSGLPFPSPSDLPDPGMEPGFSALQVDSLSSELPGKSYLFQFSSVQFSRSIVSDWLFAIPWIAARQAFLSITNSQSLLKLMSIESVMPSSHLIPCRPLLLLPPIPPSIRVFSNESTLPMRWPKYWSFSFQWTPRTDLL